MQHDRAVARVPQTVPMGDPTTQAVRVPRHLDYREKAAVIVRLLLNEGADIPLEDLPDGLQEKLTQKMGAMGLIDRVTLAAVVDEFAEALDGVGLSFPNGLAGALSALDGKISPQTAARLRKEAGVRQSGDPWARLRDVDATVLAPMAQAESIEVAAVLLSKLPTAKAAALLGQLPGPLARRITYAVSRTDSITPEAVDRIGLSLASQLDLRPIAAFDDAPGARLGAILNQSPAATREDLLTGLDETDTDFATSVRKAIFTFAHIPARLRPVDVPQVLRAADQDIVIQALGGAQADTDKAGAEFLLANMSTRMADGLREEIGDRGPVKPKEAEAAMTQIVGLIRDLAEAGEITLTDPEEEEDPADTQ